MRAGVLVIAMTACGRLGFEPMSGVASDADPGAESDAALGGIVTTGLALDLDPGDPASYPGSGAVIFDLSPRANHGTIDGAPPFTSAGRGSYFTYDGSDAMFITLGTPSPSGWTFGRQPRTLSAWAYSETGRSGYSVIVSYGTGVDSQGSYLGSSSDGTQWNFGGYFTNQYGGATATGSWMLLTGVWDGTTASLYLDGALLSDGPQPTWSAVPGSVAKIGVDAAFAGEGWAGRIGQVLYYDRALTPAEVAQNFAVTRARYGAASARAAGTTTP